MIPVFQTRYGKDFGNCFQAAVASLFELGLDDVPDFCNVYNKNYYEYFVRWLNERGLSAVPIKVDSLESLNYKDCYLLVSGKGKDGINHQVIYKNGEIVHNPNKNGKGIVPDVIDVIFPLDPRRNE